MITKSDSIANLAAALVAAQSDLQNPPKDRRNDFIGSRYTDLPTARDLIVPVLAKHGLAVSQFPTSEDSEPCLCTFLIHKSGEYISTIIRLHPVETPVKGERQDASKVDSQKTSKTDPQKIGSAITYARRYALLAIAGVASDDDDDGNAASGHHVEHRQPLPAVVKSKGIPASEVQAIITSINKAASNAELQAAWKQFNAVKDDCSPEQISHITQAKDLRKAAL